MENQASQQAILERAHHDYAKMLSSYAFFKVSNLEKSEDLVQETFLKTWRYIVKGGEIATMKAFLYHILNNLIIDEYRKPKTTSLDALAQKGFEPSTDGETNFLNTQDGTAALSLIQSLPEKYQKIMSMRYVQDLSLQEISIATGQSKNTIAVQAHRGLEKLKLL